MLLRKIIQYRPKSLPSIGQLNSIQSVLLPHTVRNMSAALDALPKVDIDPSGVFKYILLKVYDKEHNNEEPVAVIVRGYKRCDYHSDIYDEVQEKLKPLDCEPLGGGRISHDPDNKKIHIYGYSQGYGKADHEITAKLVKNAFREYTITISDEGWRIFCTLKFYIFLVPVAQTVRNMSATLNDLPKVDIDPSGVFKYILIKVFSKEESMGPCCAVIVRGYKRCNYHSDIFDEVQEKLKPLNCEPLGGGKISHEPDSKKINIFGKSQGYGMADHEITAKLVKEAFPGYTVTISVGDEG